MYIGEIDKKTTNKLQMKEKKCSASKKQKLTDNKVELDNDESDTDDKTYSDHNFSVS